MEYKIKLTLADESIRRFRSSDPHEAWALCRTIAPEKEFAVETIQTGHVVATPLDLLKLFEASGNDKDSDFIRLKVVPRQKLSFRLVRDMSHKDVLSLDHNLSEADTAADNTNILTELKKKENEYKPIYDDYVPGSLKQDFRPSSSSSTFQLARDTETSASGVRVSRS